MNDNAFIRALMSFGQGASNSAASTVSAPVDGINWLLRKAGLPVSANPMGGSDWMQQRGLTAQPQNAIAGLLGETAGMLAPFAPAKKIAGGLLSLDDKAMDMARRGVDGYMDRAGLRLNAVGPQIPAQKMEQMGLERGWFRGGQQIKDGKRSGPMYTQDASEAAGYANRHGASADMREYAIPQRGFLSAEKGYPSRLAHDVANVLDSDYGGKAGKQLAAELRTFGPNEGLTGGQLWQALESRFGNDGAAEILSKLQNGGRPAFNGAKGMTRSDEAYVFKHAQVRDANKAKFNLADYGKDDIYGLATVPMMGLLAGTSLGGSYLLNKDR